MITRRRNALSTTIFLWAPIVSIVAAFGWMASNKMFGIYDRYTRTDDTGYVNIMEIYDDEKFYIETKSRTMNGNLSVSKEEIQLFVQEQGDGEVVVAKRIPFKATKFWNRIEFGEYEVWMRDWSHIAGYFNR